MNSLYASSSANDWSLWGPVASADGDEPEDASPEPADESGIMGTGFVDTVLG